MGVYDSGDYVRELQRAILALTVLATERGLAADPRVRVAKELVRCSALGCGLGGACDGKGGITYPCPLKR
jgi:hypothetical protein